MSVTSRFVTLTEVAKRAEVRLSAASNWRARHSGFPQPHVLAGQEMFAEREVADWLQGRRIPRHRLKPHEPPGTSYGDRFLRGVGATGSPVAATSDQRAPAQESDWAAPLWEAAGRLRETHDNASALELLLGLVYVKSHHAETWDLLAGSSEWSQLHDLLSAVSLPVGTGGQAISVFRAVPNTADPALVEAVRLIAGIDFGMADGPHSTAARVSEAILNNLERGMGRSGGHITPPDVVRCLVELLEPQPMDTMYDPFCGSGELLSAAAAHASGHGEPLARRQVCGQPPHEWSWLTTTMNLALHRVDVDLSAPGNALQEDRFPGRRFTCILANPAFNLHVDLPRDRPWRFGDPPAHNANLGWLQHVVSKLEPGGRAAVVMPEGAAFAGGDREMSIRRSMVGAGAIECVVALPRHLFRFTAVPATVWILRAAGAIPDRRETLFIDARDLGEMVDRTARRLGAEDIGRIINEYRRWRDCPRAGEFAGTGGFSRAVSHDEISGNDSVLTPGRYTGIAVAEPDAMSLITEIDALRGEFNDLSRRAEDARAAVDECLAALVARRRPRGDGQPVPLGTVCDVLAGPGTVSRDGHQPSWTPLVLPRNIRCNRISVQDLDVVSPSIAARMARYRLAAGDIVTARVGTLGRYGLVLADQTGWLLGPGCVRLRPNDQANPDYLTYFLSGPIARRWLMAHADGSAMQYVSAATLRAMPIWLPPLRVQRAIVEILDPFPTAASLHDRISETASQIHARLIPLLMAPSATPEFE